MKGLVSAILDGDCAGSISQAKHLTIQGISPERIVHEGIQAAMSALDGKCTLEQFNLLEIMLAGRAVTEVMKFLFPDTIMSGMKGTLVIATLEGDVHDLGKNIFRTILIGHGFRVVDCGKDCPLPKLLEATEKEQPLAIGISGLITPIIPLVRQVKDLLIHRGLDRVKVLAGGGALIQSTSERLNVDFVAGSAFDGVRYLEKLVSCPTNKSSSRPKGEIL